MATVPLDHLEYPSLPHRRFNPFYEADWDIYPIHLKKMFQKQAKTGNDVVFRKGFSAIYVVKREECAVRNDVTPLETPSHHLITWGIFLIAGK